MLFRKLEFEARIQFALLLMMAVSVLFADIRQLVILNAFSLFYLLLTKPIRQFCISAILVLGVVLLHFKLLETSHQLLRFSAFFSFLFLRFAPVMQFASVLQDLPTGKMMASLQKLRIPKMILITLCVTLRFFPILQFENEMIQISSRLRGLSLRQPKNWLHPLRSFEYSVIPLMMRTLRIADELAASAATKGIDYPDKRSSIYPSSIQLHDYAILLVFMVWLAAGYVL